MIDWNDLIPPDRSSPIPDDQHFAGIPGDSAGGLDGVNLPAVLGTPLYLFSDGDTTDSMTTARVEQRRIQVYSMWVTGKSLHLIASTLHHSYTTVRSDLVHIQRMLADIRSKDVRDSADRSIAHLREIQVKCYELMDDPTQIKNVAALLNTIVRCEEQIGRIEGIIIERSLKKTDNEHRVKLYDFRDGSPPAKPSTEPAN